MIPLSGLIHKVSVVRYADTDDGAGGIGRGEETVVYKKRRCRIVKRTDKDTQHGFGTASGKNLQVVMLWSPKIVEGDFLKVAAGVGPNMTASEQLYRVLRAEPQYDNLGNKHHFSLDVELEG